MSAILKIIRSVKIGLVILFFLACREKSAAPQNLQSDVIQSLKSLKDWQIVFSDGEKYIGNLSFDINGTIMCIYQAGGAECSFEKIKSDNEKALFEIKKEICVNGEADECQKRTANFYACIFPASELKKVTMDRRIETEIKCTRRPSPSSLP